MNSDSIALSHCPTRLEVGTMRQGTAETGKTEWDTWDKRDKGTAGSIGAVVSEDERACLLSGVLMPTAANLERWTF